VPINATNGRLQVGANFATMLTVAAGIVWGGYYWRDISARFESVEKVITTNKVSIKQNSDRIDTIRNAILTKEDFDRAMRLLTSRKEPS